MIVTTRVTVEPSSVTAPVTTAGPTGRSVMVTTGGSAACTMSVLLPAVMVLVTVTVAAVMVV